MKRDRIAIVLIMSALAGVLLALALPAHAADCPPLPSVVDMSWVLTLGSGAVGAGAGGYLMSGRVRTKRRVVGIFALGLGAFGVALLASPVVFGAQESGPVVVVPGTPWFDQPWFLGLCGALISMGIGALKKSPAGAWLDKSALRDMAAVLIASVLAALPHLASGWPAFGYAVLGHVIAATVAWAGASGVAKVSAERKAAELDAEQK